MIFQQTFFGNIVTRFPNALRVSVLYVIALVLLGSFQSCSKEEEVEEPSPVVVDPNEPLPGTHCAPSVTEGYCDKTSYFPGEKTVVFLQSRSAVSRCRLDFYSLDGRVAHSVPATLIVQSSPTPTAYKDGFQYKASTAFTMPELPSGVYLIENKIPVIVKSQRPTDVLVLYASNTENAYCDAGGKSLYTTTNKPVEVSFMRPIAIERFSGECLKWMATLRQLSIGYIADSDMDDPNLLNSARVIVIAGHSEYWTRAARINFDRFVMNGGHALVLSGNTMWWQVRYSEDGKSMICYKNYATDPVNDPLLKTDLWTNPLLQYKPTQSIGADFQRGGYGLRSDNGWNGYKIVEPNSPLFRGLTLKKGDVVSLPTTEYDGTPIAGFDGDGYPFVVADSLGCEKIELLGFDKGFRVKETYGTFFVYKPTPASGYIINTGSTDWCSYRGMGGAAGQTIKKITINAIELLLEGENVMSF